MDLSMLLMKCMSVLVDVLLTLEGGGERGKFGSVVDDDVGVGGGESGSAVGVGSGVVFCKVFVSGMLELGIVVGVGDDCGVK
ncbi:hypothetical protein Tco_0783648 [Tanacetum coccineum]